MAGGRWESGRVGVGGGRWELTGGRWKVEKRFRVYRNGYIRVWVPISFDRNVLSWFFF